VQVESVQWLLSFGDASQAVPSGFLKRTLQWLVPVPAPSHLWWLQSHGFASGQLVPAGAATEPQVAMPLLSNVHEPTAHVPVLTPELLHVTGGPLDSH
jgi:hypothetical protein